MFFWLVLWKTKEGKKKTTKDEEKIWDIPSTQPIIIIIIIIITLPFTFGNKSHNILQFDMILNNEASVVESFFTIFSMAPKIFFQNFQ